MTGNVIAKVTNVSHRYGATVALDDVSIDIPVAHHGRRDRAGRRRQVLASRADRGRAKDSAGQGRRLRQGRLRPWQPQGYPGPHRLYAAGPGAQSLSDAERVREHRFLRPPVRAGRGGTASPHHRTPDRDRHGEVRGPPGRQALRRHEAEAQPLLRADQRSRSPHPRRADHRRRPAVSGPVLGPHQHHPRPPAADERDGRHRLHGRSRALRLADGDGRGQDHRHRDAEGAAWPRPASPISTKRSSR